MRRILGIDPGSRITGYGVIDSDGRRSIHIASGCIRLKQDELPQRLGVIFHEITELIKIHCPVEMAIEEVFVSKNANSALKLGQARGAAICAGVVANLPVGEYAPRTIKQAVVGSGAADKDQVQHMVKRLLNLSCDLSADQSDALAVALSHAHTETTLNRLARASAGGWR
ncbi:MAG: crossover junction endodeoxyribonuclease RuvC [Candidatus Polarisedimenticolaceae bacterium]|nr:crossover junction endodeoxyribonuclease RuvC [Candidatus Polarisedimenticolaceae bacterium]